MQLAVEPELKIASGYGYRGLTSTSQHQRPEFGTAKGPQGTGKIKGFENIGFTGTVVPKQNCKPWSKGQLNFAEVPEISQFELGKPHRMSLTARETTGHPWMLNSTFCVCKRYAQIRIGMTTPR